MMIPKSRFYFARYQLGDSATLERGDGYSVDRIRGVVSISCQKPWTTQFEEAYHRHKATGVSINSFSVSGWEGRSLEFLVDLPDLQHLSLNLHFPMDVTPLSKLTGLKSLALSWNVPSSPGNIDFTRLVRLKECSISWHPAFAPILRLGSLVILSIIDAKGVKELDLTALPRLAELDLMSCAALTRVDFSEQAMLIALDLTNCHKFQPDWHRLAPDLRFLRLRDRIGFAVEEVVEAQGLRFLWAEPSNKHATWEFLRNLPCLESVCIFDIRIKKKIADLFRSINNANGHGPTLCAFPKPLNLLS